MLPRRVLFLIVATSLFAASASAVTYTWNGGTAAWNVSTNWTPARGAVANTDVLVFNGGGTTTATSVPTETIGQLLVSNNTNVTLQSAGAVTVTINGLAGTDLQVAAGSQLNLGATAAANAITLAVATGATGSIGGSMATSTNTGTTAHKLTAADASGITFQSGAVFNQSTGTSGNVFGTANLNSIVFASGSQFTMSSASSSNPFGAAQPSSVVVFQTGSLYRQASSSGAAFSGRTYADFEMVSGTVSATGGAAVSFNNLTVTAGTLNLGMTGLPTILHSIKGNVSVASGATLTFNPGSAGTMHLNGGAAQSITNNGTLNLNSANQTININNASGVTLTNGATFNLGTLQLTSGNITTSNTLFLGSSVVINRTSGHIIGTVVRVFGALGSFTFPVGTANGYSPVTVNVTSGAPNNFGCTVVQSPATGMNAATSLQRYWNLSSGPAVTADLTFEYLNADVMGNEAAYKVFSVNGGVPTSYPASVVNTGTHTATLAGASVTGLPLNWTVGETAGPPPTPTLNVGDVTQAEGDAGTTIFNVQVTLTAPAGASGVSFNWATADNTATLADNDYVQVTSTPVTIPNGSSSATLPVTVNGDTTVEPNETFFVNVTGVTNATAGDVQGLGTITNDDIATTFIHDVQGSGAATPIPGATVKIEGIVIGDYQNSNQLSGFFLQEEDADADANPATSEGIFVFCSACPTPVAEGQRVQVTGSVSEFNNMTEVTASTAPSVVVTNAGNNLAQVTPSPIDLPIAGVVDDFYEAREGMKVTFVDTLTVSEYFELGRYGQTILYEGGRPRQFTEANPPSVAGNAAQADNLSRRKVILDDDNNAQEWYLTTSTPPGPADGLQYVFYPRANGGFSVGTQGTDFFRGGDLVNGLTGVLHWSFPGFGADTWRIRPTSANPATFTVANPRPATPPAVGGAIKAVGMNLLNYFTTIDTTASNSSGPCGPGGTLDCRGADSAAELNRQRARAALVICSLNADVYGFAELENTTPSASITDLLGAVNTQCGGAHPYAFVNTGGTLGTDAIRVQQIYRTGIVSPVGSPLSDLDPIHNRPPTAQTFDVVDAANPAFGQRFTVVINHFKSKGCPGTGADADAGDGQGCFNGTRNAQATRLLTWINSTVLPAAGDPDVILLGDFNSYAKEDPVNTIVAGGYTDLEVLFHGANAYSYLFDAQLGHLDYGFASASMLPQVTGADAWHINADEVDLFDYNDEIKDVGESTFEEKPDGSALVPPRVVFQPSSPYRASDHDPVLLGLFAVADVSVTKDDSPDPVNIGASLTYTITVSNGGPDTAPAQWTDTLPSGTTFVSLPNVAGWSCTTPAVGSGGTVTCNNPSFAVGSAVFTLTVTPDASVAGMTISNTTTVSTTSSDPNGTNNSDTETTAVNPAANLSVIKTFITQSPYRNADTIQFNIAVTNNGPSTATNVVVLDHPVGLSVQSVSGGNCTGASTPAAHNQNVQCTIASLASGVTENITVTILIDNPGQFTNTASVSSDQFDADTSNNSSTAIDIATASADLSIVKAISTAGPYFVGQTISYTLTVHNAGPSPGANVVVNDTPTNMTIQTVSVSGGNACSNFPCTMIPAMVINNTRTITVTATIDAAGAFSNTATINGPDFDADTSNNSSTAGSSASVTSNLAVVKTFVTQAPYRNGDVITFDIAVKNNGPDTATNVVVLDHPVGLSVQSVSGGNCNGASVPAGHNQNVQCTIASLASGATENISVTALIDGPGQFTNQGSATADQFDPDTSDNSSTAVDVATSSADVSIVKTIDTVGPYYVGETITYTLTVHNAGPSPAGFVVVNDTPTNMTIHTVTVNGGYGACASFPCSMTNPPFMVLGNTRTITVTATINAAGAFSNTATANGNDFDPDTSNNTSTAGGTTSPSADLAVVKTFVTPSPYRNADLITFNVAVTNNGPDTATNIVVLDHPVGLSVQSMSGGGCTGASVPAGHNQNVQCTIASLAASATVNITVTTLIDNPGQFTNTASVTEDQIDPVSTNNSSLAVDVATASADVSIVKAFTTAGPYYAGETVTYTLTVHNAGPSPAGFVVVNDTPTNMTIQTLNVSGGGACASFPCSMTSPPFMVIGNTRTITVTATINGGGAFSNTATANGNDFDPNTANNTSTAGGTAVPAADVSMTKSFITAGPYTVGQSIQYSLVVANAGPSTATNIVVADTPTNLLITNVSGSGCALVPCTIASLASGANTTITVTATITSTSFDNSATATPSELDPNTANNTDNTGNGGSTAVVDLSITKTLNTAGPYSAGQSISYTLVALNSSPTPAANVQLTDTPTNLTITNVSGGCTSLPCTIVPPLLVGQPRTINVTAVINAAGAFDNSATVTGQDFDPNTANNTDNTGNGGTAGPNGDVDGDGVGDAVEQAAPNGGDGNGDGIPDYQQSTVASLPAATGSGYLTLQSSCPLQQVSVTTEGAQPVSDAHVHYPHGLISFRAPCSSATFSLFVYGSAATSVYRKFGPNPPGGPQQWYGIPATFSTGTVGSLHPRRVDFSLTDGGIGDDTPVDGVIVDQGGPGAPGEAVPTLSMWMLLTLMALLAFVAVKRM